MKADSQRSLLCCRSLVGKIGGTRSHRQLDRVQEYCCEHRNPFMQGFYLVGNCSAPLLSVGQQLATAPCLPPSAHDRMLLEGTAAVLCKLVSLPQSTVQADIGQAISAPPTCPLRQQFMAAICIKGRRSLAVVGGWLVVELMVVDGWWC